MKAPALLLLAATFACAAHAADSVYPARSVRVIVPFPPAGTTDLMGRIVAQKLTEMWSQQAELRGQAGLNISLSPHAGRGSVRGNGPYEAAFSSARTLSWCSSTPWYCRSTIARMSAGSSFFSAFW